MLCQASAAKPYPVAISKELLAFLAVVAFPTLVLRRQLVQAVVGLRGPIEDEPGALADGSSSSVDSLASCTASIARGSATGDSGVGQRGWSRSGARQDTAMGRARFAQRNRGPG